MTARSGFPRVPCSVEGCTRGTTRIETNPAWTWLETGTAEPGWLCGIHWRRVPRALKARRSAVLRLRRKLLRRGKVEAYWELPPGSPARIRLLRIGQLIVTTWTRCVCVAAGEGTPEAEALPPALAEELRRVGL